MIRQMMILVLLISSAGGALAEEMSTVGSIEQAMWGDHRSEANVQRNRYRHPVGTLEFFGLGQGMSVLEIWPGGGWYTEVLAPVIRHKGRFIVATWDPEVEGQPDYRYRLPKQMAEKFAASPEVYDQVETRYYSPPESASLGDPNSIDMVLTFRNAHGWVNSGQAQDIFNEFARVLAPGGVLGVVQHRAPDESDVVEMAKLGYVSEKTMIEIAEKAGLEFEARSEINANPLDTKDHEQGVWTLPPSLTLGDTDRDKYLAIGESDRMTLRFRKPTETNAQLE